MTRESERGGRGLGWETESAGGRQPAHTDGHARGRPGTRHASRWRRRGLGRAGSPKMLDTAWASIMLDRDCWDGESHSAYTLAPEGMTLRKASPAAARWQPLARSKGSEAGQS